ncbi:MAG: F0F1 ATP synthase subunit B [Verrucomicrobiota bacterium]
MTTFSLLAAADAAAAKSGNPVDDIIRLFGSFGVDWHHLLPQLVNFALLVFVLYRYAIRPALGQMEERNRLIAQGLADAKAAEQRLADAQKAADAKLNAAADESARVLAEARASAAKTVEAAKSEAAAAAAEVLRKGQAALEADRARMLTEVRGELARLVVDASGKVLGQTLDDAQRARLNEAAAKELARGTPCPRPSEPKPGDSSRSPSREVPSRPTASPRCSRR